MTANLSYFYQHAELTFVFRFLSLRLLAQGEFKSRSKQGWQLVLKTGFPFWFPES